MFWKKLFKKKNKKYEFPFVKKLECFFDKHPVNYDKTLLVWEAGFTYFISVNACIAYFLKLRGVRTVFVICDGITGFCAQHMGLELNEDIDKCGNKCESCFKNCKFTVESLGFEYKKASEFIDKDRLEKFDQISKEILG